MIYDSLFAIYESVEGERRILNIFDKNKQRLHQFTDRHADMERRFKEMITMRAHAKETGDMDKYKLLTGKMEELDGLIRRNKRIMRKPEFPTAINKVARNVALSNNILINKYGYNPNLLSSGRYIPRVRELNGK